MRIIGIDPGTYKTGYGIIDVINNEHKIVSCGCLESRDPHSSNRYFSIYQQITEVIKEHNPHQCAIESTFFYKNQKVVMRLGEVRGVLILSAVQAGLDVFEYTPLEIKKSVVGYGKADKEQVRKMIKMLLSLKKIPKQNDVSDALAIALCHAHNKNSLKYQLVKKI